MWLNVLLMLTVLAESSGVDAIARYIHATGVQCPGSQCTDATRARKLARLFVRYGNRWKVDPKLAVCVARQESHYRNRPGRVRRCRTEILEGSAVRVCRLLWRGERGLMQVIPKYALPGYRVCTGKQRWKSMRELEDPETNICMGTWLLAYRRDKIAKKLAARRWFLSVGSSYPHSRRYVPCGRRQLAFCSRGYSKLCQRFWWVGSYNWGTHRRFCRNRGGIDHAGYPINILKCYRRIGNAVVSESVKKAAGGIQKGG